MIYGAATLTVGHVVEMRQTQLDHAGFHQLIEELTVTTAAIDDLTYGSLF